LDEVVYVLGIWLARCFEAFNTTTDDNLITQYVNTLPFSIRDFRVLVRQMVLTQFETQCFTQFIGTRNASPSPMDSVFMPLLMDPYTYPQQSWTEFKLPEFVKENIMSLKACSLHDNARIQSKDGNKNIYRWIPVWGVYSSDTLPDIQFKHPGTGIVTPLFSAGGVPQIDNIWDATVGVTKWNLNDLYYQNMMIQWNDVVGAVAKVATNICSISGDSGPRGLPLLVYTRVLHPQNIDFTSRIATSVNPLKRYISNPGGLVVKKELVRKDSKTKDLPPANVPPAALDTLCIVDILSSTPLTQELLGYFNYLILPSIRYDDSSQDTLTKEAWQTAQIQPFSNSSIQDSLLFARTQTEFTRLALTAVMMVVGEFAPSKDNDVYSKIIALLTEHGKAAGLLGSLISGLLKDTPLGGISKMVADVIPI
jgi:hypothetical protein